MKKAVEHVDIIRQFDEIQANLREWWRTSTEAEKACVRANIDAYRKLTEEAGEKGKYAFIASEFALLGMFSCYVWYDTEHGEKPVE